MTLLHSVLDIFFHLDKHLNDFAGAHPIGVYALLVTIVFCETGLVVLPFLPGDSLLFAVGALAATPGSSIHLPLVMLLLCVAANCGDLLNYSIGYRVGPAVFKRESSLLLNKQYLIEAQAFYDRHGRKTIILARFVPIVRTFAPFVAGIGKMPFSRFIGFSIGGGMLWVVLLTLAGYRFGRVEFVQKHFEIVIVAIIAISVLPVFIHTIQTKLKHRREAAIEQPVVEDRQSR